LLKFGDAQDIDEALFVESFESSDRLESTQAKLFIRKWLRLQRQESINPMSGGTTGFRGPHTVASNCVVAKEVDQVTEQTTLLDKSGCHLSDESFAQFAQDLLKALPTTGEERLDIDLSYNYIHGMPGNNKGVDANLLELAYHQVVRSINITFNPIATVDRINLWLLLKWTGDQYAAEQQKCHRKIIWIPAAFVKSSAWTTMVSSGQEDAVREYHLEYYSRGLDQQVLDALKQQPH
jgi:hypothetical protein